MCLASWLVVHIFSRHCICCMQVLKCLQSCKCLPTRTNNPNPIPDQYHCTTKSAEMPSGRCVHSPWDAIRKMCPFSVRCPLQGKNSPSQLKRCGSSGRQNCWSLCKKKNPTEGSTAGVYVQQHPPQVRTAGVYVQKHPTEDSIAGVYIQHPTGDSTAEVYVQKHPPQDSIAWVYVQKHPTEDSIAEVYRYICTKISHTRQHCWSLYVQKHPTQDSIAEVYMYKNIPHKTALLKSICTKTSHTRQHCWSLCRKAYPTRPDCLSQCRTDIPHKSAWKKSWNPWISLELSGFIRKQDQKYHQTTTTKKCTDELNSEVKQLLTNVQRKHCQPSWNYRGKLFTEHHNRKLSHGLKRFWTSMKHQRTANWGQGPWLSRHWPSAESKDLNKCWV